MRHSKRTSTNVVQIVVAAIKDFFTRLFKGKAESTYTGQPAPNAAKGHPNCRHQVPPFEPTPNSHTLVITDKDAPRGYTILERGEDTPYMYDREEPKPAVPLERVFVNTRLADDEPTKAVGQDMGEGWTWQQKPIDEAPPGVRDILTKAKASAEQVGAAIQEMQAAKVEQSAAVESKSELDEWWNSLETAEADTLTEEQAAWIEGIEAYAEGFELEKREKALEAMLREARQALQYTKHNVKRKKLEAQVKECERQLTALKNKNI